MQKNIKAIIFDLDGTLVDSMNDFGSVAQAVIHKHFGVDETEALIMYRNTSGLPFEFQLKKLFPSHPKLAIAADEFETKKMECYMEKPFFTDALDTIPKLLNAGFSVCVSSNNHEQNVLNKLKPISNYFHMILGYKEGFLKGRDHFEFIKKEFKIESDQMLFVGDSLNDARTAFQNDITFVARIGTFGVEDFQRFKKPFFKVNNFYELPHVLHLMDPELEFNATGLAS